MSLSEDIGVRVRRTREYYDLTREELAEQAHISPQFLVHIENGTKSMTTNSLYNVARALNVTTDYLVFGLQYTDHDRLLASEALASMLPKDKILTEKIMQSIIGLVKQLDQHELES